MDKKEINPKLGYSKPSSQPRLGPIPLASFEDLMTDELVSEASLIEDLPCMSECLDDKMFHETNNSLSNKRKLFERCDTWNSADLNGSLITLTTCSITPTELSSPTELNSEKTLTPVTPNNPPIKSIFNQNNRQINQYGGNQLNIYHGNQYNNQITNHFTNQNQFLNRGRDEMSKNKKQSNEALKVPLSPSITLNDIQNINDSEFSNNNKPRKNSWTNFFRSRSKSTGGACSRSRTPSFISFFSPKQSTNQLNKTPSTKSKKRRLSNLFSFFKKSTRSSLQDLSNKENTFNTNLLSTNLDRLQSSSSPKVLNCESNCNLTTNCKNDEFNLNNNQYCKTSLTNDYIEDVNNQIKLEKVVENNLITLRKTFNSKESVNEFVTKIELIMKEKDEEFDKKIKEDIYLEEKILDDLPIEELERKMNFKSPNKVNELDKKDVLLKRSLKNKRSDTLDEIRSLPERLPSFRRKQQQQQQQSNNNSSVNQDLDTNSESDDQTTTITDQLSSKKSNYIKKNAGDKIEVENLLEDEENTYNELLYKNELVNSPSQLKLLDKNERLNIKIIPIERPRSVTPVNFALFETFFNSSSTSKEIDEQEKIKLKLPELAFSELQNRRSPRKSSPQIFLEFCQKGLQTPKNQNLDDQITDQYSVEEAFSSIVNSSTNETISEYLIENEDKELNDNELNGKDNAFEDDFVNACLADLAHHVINQSVHESNNDAEKNELCFEANFDLMNQNAINNNEKLDANNNLIQNCDNCEKCKLNQLNENLECKCDCHFDNEYSPKNIATSTTKKAINKNLRRYSISSSDISSTASSRLIYSSSSSSSNSSRRHSLSANFSNERLEL